MSLINRFRAHRRLRRRVPPPEVLHTRMSEWFRSPMGAALIRAEKQRLKPAIAKVFGYHMLQMGCSLDDALLDDCPAAFKVRFNPLYCDRRSIAVASNEALPLGTESMDAVLIHHALDFTPDSHRLLREADRVLTPGGQLLVIGFNPLSLWGLSKVFRWKLEAPWNARFISTLRLSDWLKLLNFHIEEVSYGGFLLPWSSPRLVSHAPQLERIGLRTLRPLGCFYLLVATKQSVPVTPVMARWPRLRAPVIGGPLAETGRIASSESNRMGALAEVYYLPDRKRRTETKEKD